MPATGEGFSGVETVNNTSWRWQQGRTLRHLPTKRAVAVQVEKTPRVSQIAGSSTPEYVSALKRCPHQAAGTQAGTFAEACSGTLLYPELCLSTKVVPH